MQKLSSIVFPFLNDLHTHMHRYNVHPSRWAWISMLPSLSSNTIPLCPHTGEEEWRKSTEWVTGAAFVAGCLCHQPDFTLAMWHQYQSTVQYQYGICVKISVGFKDLLLKDKTC